MINGIILDNAFPINKVEVFFDNDDHSNFLGFTWERVGAGRVPVGIDIEDTDFNTIGKTGGEKEHTLTIDEMPSHNHIFKFTKEIAKPASGTGEIFFGIERNYNTGGQPPHNITENAGGGQPHNILQPYIVMAFWKRIS